LKHLDATLATYVNPNATLAIHVLRQIKHLKHTSEAFVKKTPQNHGKTYTTSR
jgi:hypothetical protein